MDQFKEFFNDGFTKTDSNQSISEGFTDSSPFLNDKEAEENRKNTSMKILLENMKRQKDENSKNLRKKTSK